MKFQINMDRYVLGRNAALHAANVIVKQQGLQVAWDIFHEKNRSAGLAYHNRFHTAWLMDECQSLLASYKGQLTADEEKALYLAAMFHDFNHSGGVLSDYHNVRNAISAMGELERHGITPTVIYLASEIISVTEYPFKSDNPPVTIAQKIIRDADVMQGMTPDFAKIIYVDLFSELLVSRPEMTFEQYVRGQQTFLRNVEMFTEVGRYHRNFFIKMEAEPFWQSLGLAAI